MGHHGNVNESKKKAESRRKARVLRAITFLLVAVLLTSCGGSTGGSGNGAKKQDDKKDGPAKFDANSTMATIQKRGKLIVAVRPDAAPFSSQDPSTGTWKGFDIELAKHIATDMFGSKIEDRIEWIPLDSRDRELALEQNRVDIALGRYSITVPRKRFVDFAGPYYIAKQDIIVSKTSAGAKGIQTPLDLNGRKVCTVVGSTNFDAITQLIPNADVSLQQKTVGECGASLTANLVSAIIAEHVDLLPVVNAARSNLVVVKSDFGAEPYGIGVHKGSTDLRQYLNDQVEGWDGYADAFDTAVGEKPPAQPVVDRY